MQRPNIHSSYHLSRVQAPHHITESAESSGPVGPIITPLQYIHSYSIHFTASKCSCGKRERGVTSRSLMTLKKINYEVRAFSLFLSLWGEKITHIYEAVKYIPPGKPRAGCRSRKHIWPWGLCWLSLVFFTTAIVHHAHTSHTLFDSLSLCPCWRFSRFNFIHCCCCTIIKLPSG